MKKVTNGPKYCLHHFGLVSFGPFEARLNVYLGGAAEQNFSPEVQAGPKDLILH
jgi:hypothetical protein